MKRLSLLWVECFGERGYKFTQIYNMNITTVGNKEFTTYKFYKRQPMQLVEMNLDLIIYELYGSVNQPLNRNDSHVPFNGTNSYPEDN